MNLLVIDWDYFFAKHETPDHDDWLLYDWGHRETGFMIGPIWNSRAYGFISNNVPLPGTTGEEHGFWNRFTFASGTPLYYGDSNALAAHEAVRTGVAGRGSHVWLYDAHHDAGYGRSSRASVQFNGVVTCEDWMILYAIQGAMLHMRYPRWRSYALDEEPKPAVKVNRAIDDGSPPPCRFDTVFVCRSGAWVPPWVDDQFHTFIDAAPLSATSLDGVAPRPFSIDDVDKISARYEALQRLQEGRYP